MTFFIERIALLFIRTVLQFLLPLPFFPTVSLVLAKAVGIDTVAFQTPSPASINSLPRVSVIPATPRLFPFDSPRPAAKVPILQPLDSTRDDTTIPLGEKVRTWRQKNILAQATARALRPPTLEESGVKRKRIDEVDFGTTIEGNPEESIGDDSHGVSMPQVMPPFSSSYWSMMFRFHTSLCRHIFFPSFPYHKFFETKIMHVNPPRSRSTRIHKNNSEATALKILSHQHHRIPDNLLQ
jgi:hypothetical protein